MTVAISKYGRHKPHVSENPDQTGQTVARFVNVYESRRLVVDLFSGYSAKLYYVGLISVLIGTLLLTI